MKTKLSDLATDFMNVAKLLNDVNSFAELDLAICYIKSLYNKMDNIRAVDFDTREVKIK